MMARAPVDQLASNAGKLLQQIEKRLKEDGDKPVKIKFPQGYIRTAANFRDRYWFVSDANLKRNIAYILILSDVYRWMLNRLDLKGIAREMLIKEGVCLIAMLCESITKDVMKGICGKGYKERVDRMKQEGIIDGDLSQSLKDLWDKRSKEHLFLLDDWELGKYELKHYNAAILCFHKLRDRLDTHFKANPRKGMR
jgi:hypothetical protein